MLIHCPNLERVYPVSAKSSGPVVAYSYVRFSSPAQAGNDSLRRQTALADAYCRRRGWTLDTSLNLHDLGVSAFRGDNALVGNLGVFLGEVKRGTVAPGSVLVCESIDRISRMGIDEGYDLIKGILKAGVRLVTLSPEREFDREATKSLSKGALELLLILERAAEESERKAERVKAAWEEKRKRAAADGRPMTRVLPAWLRLSGGKIVVDDKAAAAVRKVYLLAADGYGVAPIARKLNAEGVPPIGGKARHWAYGYVGKLLRSRAVIGEHQPLKYVGRNKPDRGADRPAIKGYFPPILSEREWYAARAAIDQRRSKRGRVGKAVANVFSGLLHDAAGGGKLHIDSRRGMNYLLPYAAKIGTGTGVAFPLPVFEAEVLRELTEIDPCGLLPGEDRAADETLELAGRLAEVEARIAALRAAMRSGDEDIEALVGAVRELEADRLYLTRRLAEARQRAATPLGESWVEAKGLLAVLAAAPDPVDARTRLKAALRKLIEGVWCLTVRLGQYRVMAVQVWFNGGGHRDYAIVCRLARGVKMEVLQSRSLKLPGLRSELDLRDPADAAALGKMLANLDVAALEDEAPRPARQRKKAG
jgi:DNA invertase Pin-like site-specific DNA recombinase